MNQYLLYIILSIIASSCYYSENKEKIINKQSSTINSNEDKAGFYKGAMLYNQKTIESKEAFNEIDYIENQDIIDLIYSYQKKAIKEKLYNSGKPIVQFQIKNNLTRNKVCYYYIFKQEDKAYFYYFNNGFKACKISQIDLDKIIKFIN